jgi:hypothetical protein
MLSENSTICSIVLPSEGHTIGASNSKPSQAGTAKPMSPKRKWIQAFQHPHPSGKVAQEEKHYHKPAKPTISSSRYSVPKVQTQEEITTTLITASGVHQA